MAEIIYSRVDSKKQNIGLTTWKNAPKGAVRKTDAVIAKNYLNENEMDELNRIVEMYLVFAENQARKNKIMYMKDWVKKLDSFLQFSENSILHDLGKVSHEVATILAESEYEKYQVIQNRILESDFDREVKKLFDSREKKKTRNVKK